MSNPEVQTDTKPKNIHEAKIDLSKIKKDSDSPGFPKLDVGKTIPVKHLAFHVPHPKLDATSNISAESRPGQRRVQIDFAPQLRHHRIEIQKPNEPVRVLFVHEVHVASWEPLG